MLSDDIALRIFGLGVGLGNLGVAIVGARMFGQRLPLFLLAASVSCSAFVRVGDSIRPYGLGMLAGMLFVMALASYARHWTARRYAWAAATAVLCVNILYQACFLVLALCSVLACVLAVKRQWRLALGVLSVGFWPALSLTAYVPVLSKARYWVVTQQTEVQAESVVDLLGQTTGSAGAWLLILLGLTLFF